jgi:hypothetical protein
LGKKWWLFRVCSGFLHDARGSRSSPPQWKKIAILKASRLR